jgi:predicted nucleic acid-binding protein
MPEFNLVDSSALIPLAWVGRLDLLADVFGEIRTTEDVRDEVLTKGKRGTAALEEFLDDASIHAQPAQTNEVGSLEEIAAAVASGDPAGGRGRDDAACERQSTD